MILINNKINRVVILLLDSISNECVIEIINEYLIL